MHPRLRYLSLATAILLLVISPFLPLTTGIQSLIVQAQTLEQQQSGTEKWFLEAYQLWLRGKYPATLEKLQQDLAISPEQKANLTFKNYHR